MSFTITGYSTALFATWYFIEELDLLFDAGDGLCAGLLQKSRKIKYVFLSHADRDHLTGLMQFNQLNARPGFPRIYYPADSQSYPALQAFLKAFDPQSPGAVWQGVKAGDEIMIGKDVVVKVIRNSHVPGADTLNKSFSFIVQRIKQKLRPEYLHLEGKQIAALKKRKPDAELLEEVRVNLIGYSGDTPVEDIKRWEGVEVLIHEATFPDDLHQQLDEGRTLLHSKLGDVMKMAAVVQPKTLILGHFSSRYSAMAIEQAIAIQKTLLNIQFAVHLVLPGKTLQVV